MRGLHESSPPSNRKLLIDVISTFPRTIGIAEGEKGRIRIFAARHVPPFILPSVLLFPRQVHVKMPIALLSDNNAVLLNRRFMLALILYTYLGT